MPITDEYISLYKDLQIWDRGDAIAEIKDTSTARKISADDIDKLRSGMAMFGISRHDDELPVVGMPISGTIFAWVHGENQLDYDNEGEITNYPVSAFPGYISISSTHILGSLNGMRVESAEQLAVLISVQNN